eukprot:jgi/Picre1/28376/NNA_003781.t1
MKALYRLGFLLRETGQALDTLGCKLQGNYSYLEQLNRARPVMNLYDKVPDLGKNVFVAPNALVSGHVQVGNNSSIFYGAVVRGDKDRYLWARTQTFRTELPLHGCVIEDEALIGMGATLLEGSRVEKGAMVAAGAIVQPGTTVPAGEIWGGAPAKHLRALKPEEKSFLAESAEHYVNVAAVHLEQTKKSLLDIAKSKGL